MTIDSAKAYVERMKTDEEFRRKVLACKDTKKIMELVKAEGFDFTEKEMKVVKAALSDMETKAIVGGYQGLSLNGVSQVDDAAACHQGDANICCTGSSLK